MHKARNCAKSDDQISMEIARATRWPLVPCVEHTEIDYHSSRMQVGFNPKLKRNLYDLSKATEFSRALAEWSPWYGSDIQVALGTDARWPQPVRGVQVTQPFKGACRDLLLTTYVYRGVPATIPCPRPRAYPSPTFHQLRRLGFTTSMAWQVLRHLLASLSLRTSCCLGNPAGIIRDGIGRQLRKFGHSKLYLSTTHDMLVLSARHPPA